MRTTNLLGCVCGVCLVLSGWTIAGTVVGVLNALCLFRSGR